MSRTSRGSNVSPLGTVPWKLILLLRSWAYCSLRNCISLLDARIAGSDWVQGTGVDECSAREQNPVGSAVFLLRCWECISLNTQPLCLLGFGRNATHPSTLHCQYWICRL